MLETDSAASGHAVAAVLVGKRVNSTADAETHSVTGREKPNETVRLFLSLSRSFTTLGSGQRKFTFLCLYLKIRLIFFFSPRRKLSVLI